MEKHVMQYQTVHFNLNGKDVERTVDVRASLTDMLRNDFRMTSVKKGCEVGECLQRPDRRGGIQLLHLSGRVGGGQAHPHPGRAAGP